MPIHEKGGSTRNAKWTGCLEMAIGTKAIAVTPTIPPLWPGILHRVRRKLDNLLIILVSKENFQVFFEEIIWDSSFLEHCLKYRVIETLFRVVPLFGDQLY